MKKESGWIDISMPLRAGMVRYPGDPPTNISLICEDPFVSHLSLCTHAGTHVDAPLHYIRNGLSIDEMPLGTMIGTARVISVTNPDIISVEELAQQNVTEGETILFKTRNSLLLRGSVFTENYVYLSLDAARLLLEKRTPAVGIDYLSIAGFNKNESDVHRTLLESGIFIIEGLDLGAVEPGMYDLVCLPLLIPGAEAAPARVMVRPRDG